MRLAKTFLAAAALVALGAVSSAYAASVTIDFTAAATSADRGADNSRSYSGGGVNLTVTAWTMSSTSSTTRTQVYLGTYNGSGLGVSNDTETNGQTQNTTGNEHTVDNYNGFDFVQMDFDKQVKILSVTIKPFTVNGSTDTDITFNYDDWYSGTTRTDMTGGATSPTTHTINSTYLTNTFNLWASLTKYSVTDGFKISSITFDYTAGGGGAAVPLPSAAFLGFGLLGGLGAMGVWRRRRRADLTA